MVQNPKVSGVGAARAARPSAGAGPRFPAGQDALRTVMDHEKSQNHHLQRWHRRTEPEQPYHLFYLLLPSLAARQALIAHLRARGILAVFHYLPLHLSAYGRQAAASHRDCPVATDAADRLVRLPLFYDLSAADQSRVIAAVQSFRP